MKDRIIKYIIHTTFTPLGCSFVVCDFCLSVEGSLVRFPEVSKFKKSAERTRTHLTKICMLK